ncbi:MAG: M4 family metallopeptidase [Planctomycetes bacterium]|nr:M4 family metallopeptidase [Planctomycetota bacterium]
MRGSRRKSSSPWTGSLCTLIGFLCFACVLAEAQAVQKPTRQQSGAQAQRVRGEGLGPLFDPTARRMHLQQVDSPRAKTIARNVQQVINTLRATQPEPTEYPVSVAQRSAALAALQARAAGAVTLSVREDVGTPREIRGPVLEQRVALSEAGYDRGVATAHRFLRRNQELLHLEDADAELVLIRSQTDERGNRHLRFSQTYAGLDVWPGDVNVHLDADGNVYLMNGAYVASPAQLDLLPTIGPEDAAALARWSTSVGSDAETSEPVLMIYAPGDAPTRLAWKVEVWHGQDQGWQVFVDAWDGSALDTLSLVYTENVTGSGIDVSDQQRALNVWHNAGEYYLVDTSKPMFDPTSTPPRMDQTRGGIFVFDGANRDHKDPNWTADVVFSSNANQWPLRDAVSTAHGMSRIYDFYREVHQRNSYDNAGANILGVVRYGQNYDNAFWNGRFLAYGDAKPYVSGFDLIGHEFTHAVEGSESKMKYENQSGALMEAWSDIFGNMFEEWVVGQTDWIQGADFDAAGRNLLNPGNVEIIPGSGRRYPARMAEFLGPDDPLLLQAVDRDHGGVHINCTIVAHAFYLLAEGMNGAIGTADAQKIFYHAMVNHMVTNEQFIDARLHCVQSAHELFGDGSTQHTATQQAFDAVEIFAPGSGGGGGGAGGAGGGNVLPDPPQFPPVQAPDSTLFLKPDPYGYGLWCLARRENTLGDGDEGECLIEPGTNYLIPVTPSRLAVSGNGDVVAYVTGDKRLCILATNPTTPEEVSYYGDPGSVSAVAMSPDQKRLAFVLCDESGNATNTITVVDLAAGGQPQTYVLAATAPDSEEPIPIDYADVMDFAADGRVLIYDAFTEFTANDGSQANAWAIYALDLESGSTSTLYAPEPGSGNNVGNPSLSQTCDYYMTFEAFTITQQYPLTVQTHILAADLLTNSIVEVDTYELSGGLLGFPCYSGDDQAILYTVPAATTYGCAIEGTLVADRITPQSERGAWLSNAAYGVIYRRGAWAGPPPDGDGDWVPDDQDNCPTTSNPDQRDSDGDGLGDVCENCPQDPNKTEPGACGCGRPDIDSDHDGVLDCSDGCPNDPNKTEPGACGCGEPETGDSDGDGVPDCADGCPNDPQKTDPGACGCGQPDTDSDGDGTPDCLDGCPDDPYKTGPGDCGCGQTDSDRDGDGTPDCLDGCPDDPYKTGPGDCGCGQTDSDRDGDGVPDCLDGCPDDPYKTDPGGCGCGQPETSDCGASTGGGGNAGGGGNEGGGNAGGGESGQTTPLIMPAGPCGITSTMMLTLTLIGLSWSSRTRRCGRALSAAARRR